MATKLKLIMALAASLAIIGCGKEGNSAASVGDLANKAGALLGGTTIKGYKSFSFGMNAVDVAKLPECINQYKNTFAGLDNQEERRKLDEDKQHEEMRQKEIAELQQLIKTYDDGPKPLSTECGSKPDHPYSTDQCHSDANEYATATTQLNLLTTNYDAAHAHELAEREVQVSKIEAEDEAFFKRVAAFAPDIVEKHWVPSATCSVDFMGEQHEIKPFFENAKLIAVELNLGGFDNEKYQSLAKALTDKYGVTQETTPEQVSAFNNAQLEQVVTTFANGQVGLYANNSNEYLIAESVEGDSRTTSAIPTVNRYMKLVYANEAYAKKIGATATRGKTKAGDL